jgi:hypothetical protein
MVKTVHAFTFVALGWFLQLLPALMPIQFGGSGAGASTSALWVKFMGWTNLTLGLVFVLNLQVVPLMTRLLAWRAEAAAQVAQSRTKMAPALRSPHNILRPALRLDAKLPSVASARRRSAAVPVRVQDRAVA